MKDESISSQDITNFLLEVNELKAKECGYTSCKVRDEVLSKRELDPKIPMFKELVKGVRLWQ